MGADSNSSSNIFQTGACLRQMDDLPPISTPRSTTRQDDVYEHAIKQVYRPAPPELVAGFREKMDFIKLRYKHNEKTVESCLRGLGEEPTLLQLLTAAFVVNGGVLFKHGPLLDEEEQDERDINELIQEFDALDHPERTAS
jgi:hypothetical protein